jgi:hypothetical protein
MIFKTIYDGVSDNYKVINNFSQLLKSINKYGFKKTVNKLPYDQTIIDNYNAEIFNATHTGQSTKPISEQYLKMATDANEQMTASLIRSANGAQIATNAINNMSIKAKVATTVVKGLSVVGNMFASWAIMFAIEKTIQQKDPTDFSVKSLPLIPAILAFHTLPYFTTSKTKQTNR